MSYILAGGASPWNLGVGSLLEGRELLQAGLMTQPRAIMPSCPVLLGQFSEHHSVPSEARETMTDESWMGVQPSVPSLGANAIAVPSIRTGWLRTSTVDKLKFLLVVTSFIAFLRLHVQKA